MPNKAKHREAIDVVHPSFKEVANREAAPGFASGGELLNCITPGMLSTARANNKAKVFGGRIDHNLAPWGKGASERGGPVFFRVAFP